MHVTQDNISIDTCGLIFSKYFAQFSYMIKKTFTLNSKKNLHLLSLFIRLGRRIKRSFLIKSISALKTWWKYILEIKNYMDCLISMGVSILSIKLHMSCENQDLGKKGAIVVQNKFCESSFVTKCILSKLILMVMPYKKQRNKRKHSTLQK